MSTQPDIETLRAMASAGVIGPRHAHVLIDEIESLRSQNAELRKAQEWQPIETAPMHKPILLWWRNCKTPSVGQYIDDERGEGWMCEGDRCIPVNQEDCTHWMPLPAAPHQEVKDAD